MQWVPSSRFRPLESWLANDVLPSQEGRLNDRWSEWVWTASTDSSPSSWSQTTELNQDNNLTHQTEEVRRWRILSMLISQSTREGNMGRVGSNWDSLVLVNVPDGMLSGSEELSGVDWKRSNMRQEKWALIMTRTGIIFFSVCSCSFLLGLLLICCSLLLVDRRRGLALRRLFGISLVCTLSEKQTLRCWMKKWCNGWWIFWKDSSSLYSEVTGSRPQRCRWTDASGEFQRWERQTERKPSAPDKK